MLQARLGENITRTTRKFGLADKILVPLLIIVLVAVIGWVLIDGLSYLEGAAGFQSGILHLILINIQYYVDLIGPFFILMITIVLVALCLVRLVINLSKPSILVILERK
jgi:membrane associated rhomboid family serine protease